MSCFLEPRAFVVHIAFFATWREEFALHAKPARFAKGQEDVGIVRVERTYTPFAFFATWREEFAFHAKPARFAKGEEDVGIVGVESTSTPFAYFAAWREEDAFHAKAPGSPRVKRTSA